MPLVYAAALELKPLDAAPGPDLFHEALRRWIGHRWPTDHNWFALGEPDGLRDDNGGIFRWEPYIEGDDALLEFTWRHFHVGDSEISWSTQAAYYARAGTAKVSLRVSNTGPEVSSPGSLLTTRPKLFCCLTETFSVSQDGYICNEHPRSLDADDIGDFVRYELFDPTRNYPVILLSPQPDGSFLVDPTKISSEFTGLGKVFVMSSAAATFSLTDELERKDLSCFHGALRAYLPGLSLKSNPFEHPLLLSKRMVDSVARMRLAYILGFMTTKRWVDDPVLHQLRDERGLKAAERRKALLTSLEQARGRAASSQDWETIAVEVDRDNKALLRQVEELTEQLREANATIASMKYQLAAKVGADFESTQEHLLLPQTVFEAAEYAQTHLSDRLTLLDSALASAAESPFSRPMEVYRALQDLSEISEAMQKGPLGKNLDDAFAELGQDYASGLSETTPKRLRQQYVFRLDGRPVACEEHLRIGGSSHDPVSCLRIYFTTKVLKDGKIVVGHIGRHLDVLST